VVAPFGVDTFPSINPESMFQTNPGATHPL
jgi:hypothetical protein